MEDNILDDDLVQEDGLLVEASKGKRFANYLIDYLVIGLGTYVFEMLQLTNSTHYSPSSLWWDTIINYVIFVLFYFLFEGSLNGKTPAKYITGTRVVKLDGSKPDSNTIMLRSLSRIVPFEPFSFLGSRPNGWHDR